MWVTGVVDLFLLFWVVEGGPRRQQDLDRRGGWDGEWHPAAVGGGSAYCSALLWCGEEGE